MVTTLVSQVGARTPVIVDSLMLMQRLLPVALVDGVSLSIAVQVLLAWDGL